MELLLVLLLLIFVVGEFIDPLFVVFLLFAVQHSRSVRCCAVCLFVHSFLAVDVDVLLRMQFICGVLRANGEARWRPRGRWNITTTKHITTEQHSSGSRSRRSRRSYTTEANNQPTNQATDKQTRSNKTPKNRPTSLNVCRDRSRFVLWPITTTRWRSRATDYTRRGHTHPNTQIHSHWNIKFKFIVHHWQQQKQQQGNNFHCHSL